MTFPGDSNLELYLRNAWKTLWTGPAKFEFAHQIMETYLHFARQTDLMLKQLDVSIDFAENNASYPRSTAELETRIANQEPKTLVTLSIAEKS